MSSQYLNSSTPNKDINLKVNSIESVTSIESSTNITASGILTGGTVVATQSMSSPQYNLQGGIDFIQQTTITTPVNAGSAEVFKIVTNPHNLTAGATVQFDVNVDSISSYDNIIISMYGFSGSYISDGTPICFIQDISPTNNRFTIGLKNIAVSQNTGVGNFFMLNITIIRGLTG